MRRALRIVVIGAGDVWVGPAILSDLFTVADRLRGSELWLVDADESAVALMARVAAHANDLAGRAFAISHTTDRRVALAGAHVVLLAATVDRLATWRLDWQLPLRHGVRHVRGENGGPGGLSHALRSIPLALSVARDVEELCPTALLINLTDPLSRVCLALARHTRVRCVGLCSHGTEGYRLVNRVLGLVEPIDQAEAARTEEIEQKITLTIAGLNHFTFILDMRERASGRDLYPVFRERVRQMPPDFALLSRRLLDAFGLFCAAGDLRVGEFLGFAHETIPLLGPDFAAYERQRGERLAQMHAVARGESSFDIQPDGARSAHLIVAVAEAYAVADPVSRLECTVSVPNGGCIGNLPAGAVVEVPAVVNRLGVHGASVGDLPAGLAALLRREIDIQELTVEAAVRGDRSAALQALLLDPHIHSYTQAEHLLDDLLRAHAKHLPQFA
ncbi:MAG: alpha-glucosidase/alpha-galactosidase [Anaerolineae bacterium]|nr:hypothetical protein [Thermoflexales bacterium]MDW8406183.1 alpha-glucosidase/alpha-galactosidase [Anaerolineae bacterium]